MLMVAQRVPEFFMVFVYFVGESIFAFDVAMVTCNVSMTTYVKQPGNISSDIDN